MRNILAILITFIFITMAYGQTAAKVPATTVNFGEIRDEKFQLNGVSCFISKKEQEVAEDYILNTLTDKKLKLKLALIVTQMRIMENKSFEEVQCGLKFFVENYYQIAGRTWNDDKYDYENLDFINEYIKVIDLIQINPKLAGMFEKLISSAYDLDYYFSFLDRVPDSNKFLDIKLARNLFTYTFFKRNSKDLFRLKDLESLFNLFYLKDAIPSKSLNEYIKKTFSKTNGFSELEFIEFYLKNANESAYKDLFKTFFENINIGELKTYNQNIILDIIEDMIQTKFLPDSYKCNFFKLAVPKFAKYFYYEQMRIFSMMKHPCLNDVIAEFNRLVIPKEGCPEIIFKDDETDSSLLHSMGKDFSVDWIDCRKKCMPNDKCIPVRDPNGLYEFINSKFEKDLNTLKEILKLRPKRESLNESYLELDYKPIGICGDSYKCIEKNLSCDKNEIIKKVNNELISTKYKKCNVDSDCSVYKTVLENCEEFSLNVFSSDKDKDKKSNRPSFGPNNFLNYLNNRLSSLAAACGISTDSKNNCIADQKFKNKAACENNICVIKKGQ
jgi:hypothetical protein